MANSVWNDSSGYDDALLTGAGYVIDTINNANTNYTNQKIAKENREFQRDTSLEFYNLQNEYNLPSAQMQRLEDAGINPFVAASKIANLNQAAELGLPTQSAIPWQSPQSFVGSFSQIASAIAALSNAKYQDALTDDVKKTLGHKLKGMILDNERSEFELASDKFFKNTERDLGVQNLRANIEKAWNEANLALEQGNVANMEYHLKNAMRYYYELQNQMSHDRWLRFGDFLDAELDAMRAEANEKNASAYERRAAAVEHYASAGEHGAREESIRKQTDYDESIRDNLRTVMRNTAKMSDNEMVDYYSTRPEQLHIIYEEAERAGYITKEQAARARKAEIEGNYAEIQNLLGTIGQAVDIGTGVSNARSNRMNARSNQRRNEIYDEDVKLRNSDYEDIEYQNGKQTKRRLRTKFR